MLALGLPDALGDSDNDADELGLAERDADELGLTE